VAAQRRDELGDRGAALPDRAVHAQHAGVGLVEDRVQGDGRLAGLAIAEDELALTPTDGDERVHDLEAGLQRDDHRRAVHDPRRLALDGPAQRRVQRSPPSSGSSGGIDHPSEETMADRHVDDASGALRLLPGAQVMVVAEHDDPHLVDLEVEDHAGNPAGELDELLGGPPAAR
jgi:hypothetical protein